MLNVESVKNVEPVSEYRPSEDEEYMNPRQIEYFRQKLIRMRDNLRQNALEKLRELRGIELRDADILDESLNETMIERQLSTNTRYLDQLKEIDAAIERIKDGTYGFCLETGERIGLQRLEARNTAMFSVDVQRRLERFEKQMKITHRRLRDQ